MLLFLSKRFPEVYFLIQSLINHINKKDIMFLRRFLCLWITVSFVSSLIVSPQRLYAQTILDLPAPGTMVSVSPSFEPALIKGLTVHKDNPFLFDFIVDPGQSKLSRQALKDESDRMIKYFFAALTIPDKDIWVNLSPYEKDRMIPVTLGETAMGRDLLAQDYMLKQLTASLIYPQKALGKTFWDTVYSKAKAMYGTTEIPVNTFNKVWIVPQRVGVYEHGQTAFIVSGHLKVMLEEDYLSMTKHNAISGFSTVIPDTPTVIPAKAGIHDKNGINAIGSQIIREIILPEIEKEINEGKNFATLRQIFYAQALAVWFKRNLKQALLNRVYANKGTVKGIDQNDTAINEAIYRQYLKAYKKGVFNYIQEDSFPPLDGEGKGGVIPRKYFSGGYGSVKDLALVSESLSDAAMAEVKDEDVDFAVLAATPKDAATLVRTDKAMGSVEPPLLEKDKPMGLPFPIHPLVLGLTARNGSKIEVSIKWDSVGNLGGFSINGHPFKPNGHYEILSFQNNGKETGWRAELLFERKSGFTITVTLKEVSRTPGFWDKISRTRWLPNSFVDRLKPIQEPPGPIKVTTSIDRAMDSDAAMVATGQAYKEALKEFVQTPEGKRWHNRYRVNFLRSSFIEKMFEARMQKFFALEEFIKVVKDAGSSSSLEDAEVGEFNFYWDILEENRIHSVINSLRERGSYFDANAAIELIRFAKRTSIEIPDPQKRILIRAGLLDIDGKMPDSVRNVARRFDAAMTGASEELTEARLKEILNQPVMVGEQRYPGGLKQVANEVNGAMIEYFDPKWTPFGLVVVVPAQREQQSGFLRNSGDIRKLFLAAEDLAKQLRKSKLGERYEFKVSTALEENSVLVYLSIVGRAGDGARTNSKSYFRSPWGDINDQAQTTDFGGIDLSQQDAAMHVEKDANGGVKVDVDPALIARVEREGMPEVVPVIINMRPADIRSLFGEAA
jgi:hypothetical protein